MNFTKVVTEIVETAIAAWNIADYELVSKHMTENINLKTEAIQIRGMETDEFNIQGLENVIEYWKQMKKEFDVKIAHFEIIETGRNIHVKCQYTHTDLEIDVFVCLNEYGKAEEIINRVNLDN